MKSMKKGSTPSSSRNVAKSNSSLRTVLSGPISSKPDKKRQEIIEEENIDDWINSIREEIFQSSLDEIYKRYLERTSYSFVVHCAHLAWIQCFDLMDLKYDPGETSSSIEKFWSPDEECKPVKSDSWTCRKIPIRPSKKPEIIRSDPNIAKSLHLSENITGLKRCASAIWKQQYELNCETTLSTSGHVVETESSRSRRKQQEASTDAESAESQEHQEESPSEIDRAEELSIFTQTISMSRQDLPMPKWLKEKTSKTSLSKKRNTLDDL